MSQVRVAVHHCGESHSSRNLKQLVTLCCQSKKGGNESRYAQLNFSILYSLRSSTQGIKVLPTTKMDLSTSVKIIKILPPRHDHKPVSQVFLNLVKLTSDTSLHKKEIEEVNVVCQNLCQMSFSISVETHKYRQT